MLSMYRADHDRPMCWLNCEEMLLMMMGIPNDARAHVMKARFRQQGWYRADAEKDTCSFATPKGTSGPLTNAGTDPMNDGFRSAK